MNKKIDTAWISLLFSVPGLLFAVTFLFGYFGYGSIAGYILCIFATILSAFSTGYAFSCPFEGELGLAGLAIAFGFGITLLVAQAILLIPAWLLLKKSENKILAGTIKIFFLLLLLFMALPFFGETERYLIIAGIIPLVLIWLLITGRIRKMSQLTRTSIDNPQF